MNPRNPPNVTCGNSSAVADPCNSVACAKRRSAACTSGRRRSNSIGDPNELLRRRPDVQAAERRLAQATELQGSATAELFPHVTFGGFLGFIAGRGSTFFQSDSEAWSFTPSISWPALDYWRFKARVRQSSAESSTPL